MVTGLMGIPMVTGLMEIPTVTGLVEIPQLLVSWKFHDSSRGNATCREMPRVFTWKSHGPSCGSGAFHGNFWHFPCEPHMAPHVETCVKVKL